MLKIRSHIDLRDIFMPNSRSKQKRYETFRTLATLAEKKRK